MRRRIMRRAIDKFLPLGRRGVRFFRLLPRGRLRRRAAEAGLGEAGAGQILAAPALRPPRQRRLPVPLARLLPATRPSQARVYARRGQLEVRLATKRHEIRASQALRFRVFYREMSARAGARARFTRRDRDRYDRICDHMLVVEHGVKRSGIPLLRGSKGRVVATYRLLPQEVAARFGGFYSMDEYDIAPLIEAHRDLNFLELGRSCVLQPYRNKFTIEMLWQGVWGYVRERGFDVMIGCASLAGTDPDALAMPLSFLHHTALAPEEWRVRARPNRFVDMNRMAKADIDLRKAMRSLPPLIKGYLRLGAYFGEGAVVDHQFGTTDVLVVMPVANINARYLAHFGRVDDPVAEV
jgi:putative hemolysin